jgi:hypothetical protein
VAKVLENEASVIERAATDLERVTE